MTFPVTEQVDVEQVEVIEIIAPRTIVELLTPSLPDTAAVIEVYGGGQGPKGDLGPTGEQGLPGPIGPTGPTGEQGPPAQEYTYRFPDPAMQWVITHNLGTNPTVTVLDLYDNEISADVSYPDKDHVVIDFAVPFAGVARLRA